MIKYIARYGAMRIIGLFTWNGEGTLFHGTKVIVHTSRGQEAATILCEASEAALKFIKAEMEEDRVLRLMTPNDEKELRQMKIVAKDEFIRCKRIVDNMKIVMDLVRVERIFGGERVIIYYVAEGRIDFRELVKVLAAEFQTRIEMKQIGVRDETKLLADIGDCGREVCCNSWLVSMPPVSMRMAKLQKATLDPTKISGRCGRLKCCLRYEYDAYHEILKILPAVGKMVLTPDGIGRVIAQELLAKKVQVELLDHSRKMYGAEDIQPAPKNQIPPQRDFNENADPENAGDPEQESELE
ncbi:MAG: regulatory iron-sulfur-containing complex subunit RicT [Planctomycetia bacterium]|nr:regulatory iron-sulfur-containing complex subunit RicT [Planctomycetia bacterium]